MSPPQPLLPPSRAMSPPQPLLPPSRAMSPPQPLLPPSTVIAEMIGADDVTGFAGALEVMLATCKRAIMRMFSMALSDCNKCQVID